MDWLTVGLPGCRIVYFPAGAAIDLSRLKHQQPWLQADDEKLATHPRIRRILWQFRNQNWKIGPPGWEKKTKSHNFSYGLLHWNDGADLAELDRKVCAGEATEFDFSGCAPAYCSSIRCLKCGSSVLTVGVSSPEGPSYFNNKKRLEDYKFYRHCPACGQDDRWPLTVEFIDQESWPDSWEIRADPS